MTIEQREDVSKSKMTREDFYFKLFGEKFTREIVLGLLQDIGRTNHCDYHDDEKNTLRFDEDGIEVEWEEFNSCSCGSSSCGSSSCGSSSCGSSSCGHWSTDTERTSWEELVDTFFNDMKYEELEDK